MNIDVFYTYIENYRVDMFKFSYHPELGMMKYLYGAIKIMTDDVFVLWTGREGVLPSLGS